MTNDLYREDTNSLTDSWSDKHIRGRSPAPPPLNPLPHPPRPYQHATTGGTVHGATYRSYTPHTHSPTVPRSTLIKQCPASLTSRIGHSLHYQQMELGPELHKSQAPDSTELLKSLAFNVGYQFRKLCHPSLSIIILLLGDPGKASSKEAALSSLHKVCM